MERPFSALSFSSSAKIIYFSSIVKNFLTLFLNCGINQVRDMSIVSPKMGLSQKPGDMG